VTTSPPEPLLSTYRPVPDSFDEMVSEDGQVRDHWTHLSSVLDGLGLAELNRRRTEAANLLEDDGVSYNVYGDGGRAQPWALDPVPVVLTSAEWAGIETAVIQRAELLNLILIDLYGPRDLLKRGLIPPELIFGHSGFLRQCDGIRIRGPRQLFTYGADIARDREGRRWILSDRTQAPSGAAYAAANRSVLSRVFPSLYRDAQVHRLAPFFRALRSGLEAIAPQPSSEPRIVILSPGPRSETAFEHGSLAAQLGYQLVEGSDLRVERGRVWLRSVGHPEPVDVILRRVDSWYCDPLELRPDSYLGVPGLVEACRRGAVAVVNSLGSGVLENPGLLPFLPNLAERLLGESLAIPSAPTWWCGDAASLSHVLAHLGHLVLKPIQRAPGPTVRFGWMLSSRERDELRLEISTRPHAWVGQEAISLSSAPTLGIDQLEARPGVMRAFAVVGGDAYLAMAGGLTTVAAGPGKLVSNQAGAVSKDTWVLASEPERGHGYWHYSGPIVPAAEPQSLVSARVAENLVWLGRYAERAEGAVRLLRVVHGRRTEFADGSNPPGTWCVQALLAALTHVTSTYPGFAGSEGEDRLREPGAELQSLATDTNRPGTLAYAVARLLDAAYAARDQMSMDTWLVVSSLHRDLLDVPALGRFTLRKVLASLLALEGLAAESMVREPGWWLMDAGRRIERGIHLAALLRATVTVDRNEAADSLLMESVLSVAESIITYRRRYHSHAQLETFLDLMLLDPDNPRSLAYQLERLTEDLAALPKEPGRRMSDAEKPVLEASTALQLADTAQLASTWRNGERFELAIFLQTMIQRLQQSADGLEALYFAHPVGQRSFLTPADPGPHRTTQRLMV
jgi:uncharacterized circularly permuted ATP-grasp superfamily protein/uncharacterized alpha-E superfamily protein